MLILARGLQGIGGGGLLPIAQTIIADMLSPRERPIVQGRTSIMFMSASILGPVLGGLLTDHLHWSLIFWINVPLGAIALVMTERALRSLPRNDRPHQLDVIGAALMVGAALVADAGAGLGRHALSVELRHGSLRCSAVPPRYGCCSRCGCYRRASRSFRWRSCTAA